ncbi:unnamed protein product [Protopolystoma xenopodis]|uniref:Uncharacterized protein n=1 Tax=Protopolystoma xenopodis TaxID=117903 RepID=A0A3S5A723_9PLAT|nr:unnamed protein product [Protopolystoma xenopodis]
MSGAPHKSKSLVFEELKSCQKHTALALQWPRESAQGLAKDYACPTSVMECCKKTATLAWLEWADTTWCWRDADEAAYSIIYSFTDLCNYRSGAAIVPKDSVDVSGLKTILKGVFSCPLKETTTGQTNNGNYGHTCVSHEKRADED